MSALFGRNELRCFGVEVVEWDIARGDVGVVGGFGPREDGDEVVEDRRQGRRRGVWTGAHCESVCVYAPGQVVDESDIFGNRLLSSRRKKGEASGLRRPGRRLGHAMVRDGEMEERMKHRGDENSQRSLIECLSRGCGAQKQGEVAPGDAGDAGAVTEAVSVTAAPGVSR